MHWQENLATRVAGEAELLDVEIGKLRDDDLEDALRLLHTAHTQILAGCDIMRDLRRKVAGAIRGMNRRLAHLLCD